jgi:hypothetical protein
LEEAILITLVPATVELGKNNTSITSKVLASLSFDPIINIILSDERFYQMKFSLESIVQLIKKEF